MRTLPDPGLAGDDGTASGEVAAALDRYAARPASEYGGTLAVLQRARLLVPVTAVLGEVEHDERGLAHDKSSDMAAVLLRGRDGRTALLAFTSSDSMRRWDPQARPVPVRAPLAAEAALQDGAAALVVDLAGPVSFVIETEDLRELARGSVLVEVNDRYGWATPGR